MCVYFFDFYIIEYYFKSVIFERGQRRRNSFAILGLYHAFIALSVQYLDYWINAGCCLL